MTNPIHPITRFPNTNAKGGVSSRQELIVLLAGLIAFFLINLVTAERTPSAWSDEVMYQDPAVNWHQGRGFTSGAWFLQTNDQFWAGNVPLYQFFLHGWLEKFGFGIVTVRAFHYLLMSAALLVAWAAIRRLRLIPLPGQRLIFCLVISLCTASVFVYRFARPESLAMLLMSFGLLALTARKRWVCLIWLVLIGGLLTWNGLQFAAFAGLLFALSWLPGWQRWRREAGFVLAGCLLGGFFLWLFYRQHGVWREFVICIRHHTIANQGTNFANTHPYGSGLREKLRQIPGLYLDFSFFPILALALWMSGELFRSRSLKWQSPLVFGWLACLCVPLGMHAVGIFPIYYFWMAFFPLVLGVCAELGRWLELHPGRTRPFAAALLLGLACLMGLPRRLTAAGLAWRQRSYQPVMALAAPYVARNEFVFSEFASYYAAKQKGAAVILPNYYPLLSDADKARVSVAIVHGKSLKDMKEDFGGEWLETQAKLSYPPEHAPPGLREKLDSREYNDLRVFIRPHPPN